MSFLHRGLAATLLAFLHSTLLNSPLSTAYAQGSLTPPGAPAPLFKTLTQVEPRTPVQTLAGDGSAVFVITNSGSYYLTGNVTGAAIKTAIAIDADNVALDLNGFAIVGVVGANRGIEIRNNHSGLAIENGSIRSFVFSGIFTTSPQRDVRIERITVSGISGGGGIVFNNSSTNVHVRNCSVSDVSGDGINIGTTRGTVEQCQVFDGDGNGIVAATVTDCEVNTIRGLASGIVGQIVANCMVTNVVNTNTGIAQGINAITVTGCSVSGVTTLNSIATGILANSVSDCVVNGITASGGGGATGINANNVVNCRAVSIGNATTNVVTSIGISASSVQNCSVSFVGGSGSSGISTGISASNVANCVVATVGATNSTSGSLGITSSLISGSTVGSVFSGGVTAAAGISGDTILDSRVTSVVAGGSGSAFGLIGYRSARNCTLGVITAAGAGTTTACSTSSAGRTENVVVNGGVDIGIAVTSGHTITGCMIGNATTAISATGTRNVIDGNNLIGASTTGILVDSGANNAQALVIRNQVRNCTTNFNLNGPCQVGPIISATNTIASTSPWANFTD